MDSEDFFSTIAKFLIQFKKVCTERFPQTPRLDTNWKGKPAFLCTSSLTEFLRFLRYA